MDDLSSTILLPIFKLLDSLDIVKIRPVCKKWLEIIEENRSLWRRPVLTVAECVTTRGSAKEKAGWPISTLERFDRKSQSTLEEVSYSPPQLRAIEEDLLVQLLERSKETLRFLTMTNLPPESPNYDLSWKWPHLVELRLSYGGGTDSRISLRWNEYEDSNNQLGSVQNLSSLKVLWGWEFRVLFESHLHLLSNITSLSVFKPLKSSEWRRVVEVPSKTLKHLRMRTARASLDSDCLQLSTLHFPRLKVLQTWSSQLSILPAWLSVPTTSILISESGFPVHLPSISILCLNNLRGIQGLESKCPLLVELEVGRKDPENFANRYPELIDDLILVLKKRKQQSKGGFEVDGVKMTPLKRLVMPFDQFKAVKLKDLRGLVEELIDLKSVSPFIEVEV